MNEWEAKYKALLMGIDDKTYVENAERLVSSALNLSVTSTQSFGSVMWAMLCVVRHQQKLVDVPLQKIKPIFAWYDFWVGLFYDKTKGLLYFLPFPMLGIRVYVGDWIDKTKEFIENFKV